jgi:hypothetical protein
MISGFSVLTIAWMALTRLTSETGSAKTFKVRILVLSALEKEAEIARRSVSDRIIFFFIAAV